MKRRQQLYLLREHHYSTEADMAQINYIPKGAQAPDSLPMICTDSTWRTYESIQIEDQKSQIKRHK